MHWNWSLLLVKLGLAINNPVWYLIVAEIHCEGCQTGNRDVQYPHRGFNFTYVDA